MQCDTTAADEGKMSKLSIVLQSAHKLLKKAQRHFEFNSVATGLLNVHRRSMFT